jgi:predicted PurR-regulated permease PerM
MLRPLGLERINKILFFTILISIILYFGKELFVLITFSGFFAMLMTPVSNWLENKRISRVFSSLISILVILVIIWGIVMLLSAQLSNIGRELPQIESRLHDVVNEVQSWLSDNLGVSTEKIKDHASDAIGTAGNLIKDMVKGIFTFVGRFILFLVFTFLFLLQRDKYERFIIMLSKKEERAETEEVLNKITKIAHHYLAGRVIAVFMIGILYIIGFSIIGLRDGVILSALAALVTIIPYIGALLGGLIPLFMSVINGSLEQSVWIVIIVLIVNAIDHYIIEPYVVGGSVSISPMFTILILILGGVVWGLAGIILFLPMLGILKIICENVEGLAPYAYLIGDQKESSASTMIWMKLKGLFRGKK